MDEDRRKLIMWIAAGGVIFLVFGNQGFRDMASNWQEKRRMEKSLVQLHAEHDRLARELLWIQKDPAYTEYLIRKNLGYVKKGEIEYSFPRQKKS
jgi:cell division protein FtsB